MSRKKWRNSERGVAEVGGSVRGRRSAEGGECRGGSQAGGKIADERDHGRMPAAIEAEEIHFLQCLIGGPFFNGHAIGGDEDAGAIFAEVTMDENFLRRVIAEESEELHYLLIGGRVPAIYGNIDEAHAERFDLLAFPKDFCRIFEAQIDDGSDAEFFEFGQAL